MVVYACGCLNVRIFAQKVEGKPKAGALGTCPLGSSCEYVELIDQGFHFNHKCLVHRVSDKDWTVYMCVSCRLKTHAVNHDARLVVVNTEMKRGQEAIQAMRRSPNYSPVFNLLLTATDGKQKDGGGVPLQNYETLQKQLGDLQTVLAKYLKHEEEEMEKRIREYEEEQRMTFEKSKEKAQREKTRLVSVLFHNCEGNNTPATTDKGPQRGHAVLSHSRSANEYGRGDVTSHRGKENRSRRMRDSSPDVFAMDGLDISEGDEDPESRSGNRVKSDRPISSDVQQFGRIRALGLDTTDEAATEQDGAPLMSSSMPISMPAHALNLRSASRFDDDLEETAEFDDIPKNMQALSESIQERDRYIFGDRPRQRVNTGDFTQVNWH